MKARGASVGREASSTPAWMHMKHQVPNAGPSLYALSKHRGPCARRMPLAAGGDGHDGQLALYPPWEDGRRSSAGREELKDDGDGETGGGGGGLLCGSRTGRQADRKRQTERQTETDGQTGTDRHQADSRNKQTDRQTDR